MTHDEIVAKIREALPEAEERVDPHDFPSTLDFVVEASGSKSLAVISVHSADVMAVLLRDSEILVACEHFHPSRLDDAITIARLWATLGEPR